MPITLDDIAGHVRGTLVGNGGLEIAAAATLETAGPADITLIDSPDKLHLLAKSRAAAAIVPPGSGPLDRPSVEVADVHAAFAAVITRLRPPRAAARVGVSPLAVVDRTARIGADVDIHPLAAVGADVEIGAGATIHSGARIMAGCRIGAGTTVFPNAVLYENTLVGARCLIHANAVLGAYGFGYKVVGGEYALSAQLGWVELGDDVEIGAGTTIDRGTYGATSIGAGTKLDNLVMIAHNCVVGPHSVIVAQSGLSGSTTTGHHVTIAGHVGTVGHIHIGSGAILTAKSGVTKDVPEGQTWRGAPARPIKEQMEMEAYIQQLPQLARRLKAIEGKKIPLSVQARKKKRSG